MDPKWSSGHWSLTRRLFHLYCLMGLIHGAAFSNLRAAVVTNCDEASLRAAMASGGNVTFACDGTIVLTNTITVTNNIVLDGSGHSVAISGNDAVRVFVVNSGAGLTVSNLTITRGHAPASNPGAGILSVGILRAFNCTFSENRAQGSSAVGGAIYSGSLSILNGCTFMSNSAGWLGGAIGKNGGVEEPVLMTNCTFVGNSAARGAAIFATRPPNWWAVNCTFVGNIGTGIEHPAAPESTESITLKNCIVANSSGSNCLGNVIDGGHNVIADASGNFTNVFSLINTDPKLGVLTNNGGTTWTMLPQPDSPAINGGSDQGCPPMDQRGAARPFGPFCDVGAVEAQYAGTQAGVLRFASTTYAVNENEAMAVLTVARAGGAAGVVTVNYATTNATAVAGLDYMATNGTLTFAAGEISRSFAVPILDNSQAGSNRSLNVTLSDPTGGASLDLASAELTILEDETGLAFSAANYSVNESGGSAVITVLRYGKTNNAVSAQFASSNGTATVGADYRETNGVLNFAPGQVAKTFSVAILEDVIVEGDETVQLSLFNPGGGAVLGEPSLATLTISENDSLVTECTEASLRSALNQGGTVYLTCDGTIVLTNTITITNNAVLDGSGHNVTISGANAMRVFSINAGIEFTLIHLTVANGGGTFGGAGALNSGTLKVINCMFTNNVAMNGSATYGGAIQNYGTLKVTGSTFLNNSAGSVGGAIASGTPLVYSTAIAITNSTFVGNTSPSGGTVFQLMGLPSWIINCTFAGNTGSAVAFSSGLPGQMGPLTLKNTIVTGSSGMNLSGVTDGGHNINSDGSGSFTSPFSLNNTDPGLGPLTNNGGPTLTMSLLADSPAIDAGDDSTAPAVDQRGVSRPAGFYSDIGAYEATIVGANAGVFQIGAAPNPITEANTNLLVSIVRAGGLAGTVSVNFSTSNGTASAGSDYTATNGTVVFAAGQRSNSFIVPLLEDEMVEGTETFSFELSNPTSGAILGRASPEIMILDNEASFQFLGTNFSAMETNGAATITVTRLGDTNNAASVNYATSNGTAVAGSDYVSASGVLNFARGQTSATFSVSIQEDSLAESNETVHLMLSNPGSETVLGNPSTATLTIADNDPVPPLRFSSATYSVSEGMPEAILTVLFGNGADHSVSVNLATSDGTALAGSDYAMTNGTLTFAPGETVKWFKVRLFDNAPVEGNEIFTVALSDPTGGAGIGSPSSATVTIIDALQTVQVCDEAALRAAVSAGGRVTLACDGTIGLTSPLIISNGVSLDASSHSVSISGSNATRLFIVEPGAALTLRELVLRDGLARGTNSAEPGGTGGTGVGGAICNNGGLIDATDCLFLRNTASGGRGGPAAPIGSPGYGGLGRGGAIFSTNGQVFLSNCTFTANAVLGGSAGTNGFGLGFGGAADGGAISTLAGRSEFINCVIASNNASPGLGRNHGALLPLADGMGHGGAIHALGGDMMLQDVRLLQNSCANGNGGAINQSSADVTLVDCTLDGNHASGGGGGIYSSGVSRLMNTTLKGNVVQARDGAPAFGGAIFTSEDFQALNCTVAGNSAIGGRVSAFGGGIYHAGAALTLIHVTIASNTAVVGGAFNGTNYGRSGGIFSTNGLMTLRNSLLAYNRGSNCFGTLTDAGHNISSDASCQFTAPGSLNSTDPKLGPLADYGGPTPTMALSAGSPAIDAANSAWCPPTDQRGIVRPYGAGCDIGAFESAPPYTILGYIKGYLSPAGIALSADGPAATADSTGLYTIHGLTPGSYTVTPSASDVIFVLSNHVCSVGPDVVNADFHSYRSNAWTVVSQINNALGLVFAGATGETYQVFVSTNLNDWAPSSTNVMPPSGILEFDEVSNQHRRFFKALRP